jgi:PAS domain S-box-containing protein
MERSLSEHGFIVSKTDLKGKITYCNQIFMKLAEYEEEELIGAPHSIIRHEKMPKGVFKLLWQRIQNKEEIFAFVINKTKNGNHYWVYANVTASVDTRGNIIGYYSVRRKPNPAVLSAVEGIYSEMISIEKKEGVDASINYLLNLIAEKGVDYDEFIINLQG